MFKSFISYILGFVGGFVLCLSFGVGMPSLGGAITIVVITFILALLLSNKVHMYMKRKHDDMVRSRYDKKSVYR